LFYRTRTFLAGLLAQAKILPVCRSNAQTRIIDMHVSAPSSFSKDIDTGMVRL